MRALLAIILLLTTALPGHSAPASATPEQKTRHIQQPFTLHFANNSSLLMLDYRTNEPNLQRLHSILRNTALMARIDSVTITAASSMCGTLDINTRLSARRAQSIKNYILWKQPNFKTEIIKSNWNIINWDTLLHLIQDDPHVPFRQQLIDILTTRHDDQITIAQIRQLDNGNGEKLIRKYEKYMRQATCIVFHVSPPPAAAPDTLTAPPAAPPHMIPPHIDLNRTDTLTQHTPSPHLLTSITTQRPLRRPLFAVKTNLLYDAATALNIAIEVPLGPHWSLAGEWIFPWWHDHQKHYHFQILSGNIEAKYWFKPALKSRGHFPILTGWYAGGYVGGGIYDFEYSARGYQGESFLSAGLMGGYAHSIGKSLRLEYSLGLGYMKTQFRRYQTLQLDDNEWHRIRLESQHFSWIGPTHLKISLVWLINYKKALKCISLKP